MSEQFVVTIAREYGSNGRIIGKKVAELLNAAFYDSELITMAARKSGISQNLLNDIDEKAAHSLMYSISVGAGVFSGFGVGTSFNMPLNDKLFLVQADIIKEIAAKENAVIVGRCSDYLLRDHETAVNAFIYAPYDVRKKTVAERYGISVDKAAEMIVKKEKQRKSYYNYYAGRKWGQPANYDLCIDSSVLGIEETANLLADFVKKIKQK
ncbi:MAG: cytidylate kinase-like family protein [Clostridiales bacterium]|nr:cytidylate kinase-like family protein [Clostridiales bacterium]